MRESKGKAHGTQGERSNEVNSNEHILLLFFTHQKGDACDIYFLHQRNNAFLSFLFQVDLCLTVQSFAEF